MGAISRYTSCRLECVSFLIVIVSSFSYCMIRSSAQMVPKCVLRDDKLHTCMAPHSPIALAVLMCLEPFPLLMTYKPQYALCVLVASATLCMWSFNLVRNPSLRVCAWSSSSPPSIVAGLSHPSF